MKYLKDEAKHIYGPKLEEGVHRILLHNYMHFFVRAVLWVMLNSIHSIVFENMSIYTKIIYL